MSRYVGQVNPRQKKSVKSTPVSEGGWGLSPGPNISSVDDIRKTQQNVRAKYWYDKYEELVKDVAYQQGQQGQNFKKLEAARQKRMENKKIRLSKFIESIKKKTSEMAYGQGFDTAKPMADLQASKKKKKK